MIVHCLIAAWLGWHNHSLVAKLLAHATQLTRNRHSQRLLAADLTVLLADYGLEKPFDHASQFLDHCRPLLVSSALWKPLHQQLFSKQPNSIG